MYSIENYLFYVFLLKCKSIKICSVQIIVRVLGFSRLGAMENCHCRGVSRLDDSLASSMMPESLSPCCSTLLPLHSVLGSTESSEPSEWPER